MTLSDWLIAALAALAFFAAVWALNRTYFLEGVARALRGKTNDLEKLTEGFPHEECKVPPAGWKCTRPAGHPGPCAAELDPGPQPIPGGRITAMPTGCRLFSPAEQAEYFRKVSASMAPDNPVAFTVADDHETLYHASNDSLDSAEWLLVDPDEPTTRSPLRADMYAAVRCKGMDLPAILINATPLDDPQVKAGIGWVVDALNQAAHPLRLVTAADPPDMADLLQKVHQMNAKQASDLLGLGETEAEVVPIDLKNRKLLEERAKWEKGLEPLSVIPRPEERTVLVILRDPDSTSTLLGKYHLHRYWWGEVAVRDAPGKWYCSADGRRVTLEAVFSWLNNPSAISSQPDGFVKPEQVGWVP